MARTITYRDAISEALVQCMEADASIFVVGGGVDDVRGVWGTTVEARRRFGPRVFDVPNCENAMGGVVIGAAALGMRPVWVHARNDFMFLALDQLINMAAKWKYMYGHARGVPIVVRGVIGRGWGQGATHCQSIQATLAHYPGLYVGMPSTPADAKGMLVQAMRGEVPTLVLEHRALYDHPGEVPESPTPVPFGSGAILRRGQDVTIVGASLMAYEALRAAALLQEVGVSAEVIDPRSIRPLDWDLIRSSVESTGRLVVVDTSWAMCGFSAEVVARAAETCLGALKAPPVRVTPPDHPAPVSQPLEDAYHPSPRSIANACLDVMNRNERADTSVPDVQKHFMGPY